MDLKTYSECIELPSFEERYRYLRLTGVVGEQTFAHQRHLNQTFYTSREWRDLRNHIITRDFGRDLACEGYEIFDALYIHHINPITPTTSCTEVGRSWIRRISLQCLSTPTMRFTTERWRPPGSSVMSERKEIQFYGKCAPKRKGLSRYRGR